MYFNENWGTQSSTACDYESDLLKIISHDSNIPDTNYAKTCSQAFPCPREYTVTCFHVEQDDKRDNVTLKLWIVVRTCSWSTWNLHRRPYCFLSILSGAFVRSKVTWSWSAGFVFFNFVFFNGGKNWTCITLKERNLNDGGRAHWQQTSSWFQIKTGIHYRFNNCARELATFWKF